MAHSEEKPERKRRNTSGAASGRCRSSRPSSSNPHLSRVISGNHLDDQSQYNSYNFRGRVEDEEAIEDDEDDLSEKDTTYDSVDLVKNEVEDSFEVDGGVRDLKDVGAGPKLLKTKSSKSKKSLKDPNLVGWEGLDDPENPKNWTFKIGRAHV